MIWLRKYWKALLLAALIAGAALVGYVKGADSVQAKWDADVLRLVKEQLAKNQADAAKLKKLEEMKNENLVEIDRLRVNNHALWMRLRPSACGGSDSPGANNTAGGGQLPEGASSRAERAINEFDKRWADEAYRADKMTEDCRVLNDFVK